MTDTPMAPHVRVALLLALCLVCGPLPCRAGETPMAGAPARVVLPLQLTAEGELNAARRLAEQGRWDLALPMLQALLDGAPDGLIRDEGVYRPIARVIDRLLTAAPPQALRNYVLLYEPAASMLYEKGVRERSAAVLRQASRRCLHTPSGVRALGALAGLLMDEGRFGSALLVLGDAEGLALPSPEAAGLAARRIVCLAHLGRRAEADSVAAALASTDVETLTVAGKSWEPVAFVAAAFDGMPPGPAAAGAEAVSTAGDASGNALPPAGEPDVASALSLELPPPAPPPSEVPAVPATRAVGTAQGVFVARSGVTLAVTGRPPSVAWAAQAPGWLLAGAGLTSADESLTPYFVPSTSLSQWLTYDNYGLSTLTVADGRLYAVQFDPAALGFPETPWEANQDDLRLTNQLSCMEAASGKLLWSLGGGLPIAGAGASDYWFFTAPTVSDGRAFVLAARKGDLMALCLDAGSGRAVWQSPIGPLESRQEIERYWTELFLSDAGPPSVADGVAVYPTGQGVVCAVDAWDGSPRWVSPYARAEALIDRSGSRVSVPSGSWLPRQPLIVDGLCLVTPSDSRALVALSLRTGELRWQAEFQRGVAMLGAAGGRLFVQTASGLRCLSVGTGDAVWHCDVPLAVGAGALGRAAIYVPEEEGLLPVDVATGRAGALLRWPAGCRTWGNLSFCGGSLVAAAPDRLTVCPPAGQGTGPTAPDNDATRQDLALARLRDALAGPAHGDAAATYMDLCRQYGSERRAGPLASSSFWTALAAVVREQCAHDPALRQAFAAADTGRWSPFRASVARAPQEGPALRGLPTGRLAWTVDGYAALPAEAEGADDPLLVVGKGRLSRVEPRDGSMLWTVDLPPPTPPEGWNPAISLPPPQYVAAGMPAYLIVPPAVVVAMPAGFLSLDPASGAVRWVQDADWRWAQNALVTRIPRQELVERALAGLPLPPGEGNRTEPMDGLAASRSVACRLYAGHGLQALDPASGRELVDLRLKDPRQTMGARVATVDGGLVALLQNPERLLYYDLLDTQPLAEWRFRSAGPAHSMVHGPDQILHVADYEGIYRFDFSAMELTGKWPVEGGVDRVLGADGEMVLASTLDGRLVGLREPDGAVALDVSDGTATPVWAARAGQTVVVLDAAGLRDTRLLGQEAHFSGTGFVLRALRVADGAELWSLAWPGERQQFMAPPRLIGGLWLLRSTQPGLVRIAGVEPATGKETFAVELPASQAPGPASLLVRDGRLIVGYDARVVALAAGDEVE